MAETLSGGWDSGGCHVPSEDDPVRLEALAQTFESILARIRARHAVESGDELARQRVVRTDG